MGVPIPHFAGPAFYPLNEQSEPNSSPLSQEDRHCERNLLALPARLGGIALANPTDTEFLASQRVTEPLQQAVLPATVWTYN